MAGTFANDPLFEEAVRLGRRWRQIEPIQSPWWDEIAGVYADNPRFDEAMRLGKANGRSKVRAKTARRRKGTR
jgi:hypothetical protein